MCPACRHKVDGFYYADDDDPGLTATITNNADGFYRQEDGKCLAGLVVVIGLMQLFDKKASVSAVYSGIVCCCVQARY